MQRYRIENRFVRFGPGQLLLLAPAQIKPRAHALEVVEAVDADSSIVRTTAMVDFKVGEIIGIPDAPKALSEQLVPLASEEPPQEQQLSLVSDAPSEQVEPPPPQPQASPSRPVGTRRGR